MSLEVLEGDGTSLDLQRKRTVLGLRLDGHGNVAKPATGEDLQAGAVTVDDQVQGAVVQRRRRAMLGHHQFLLLHVVNHGDSANAEHNVGRRAGFQDGTDFEQFPLHLRQRILRARSQRQRTQALGAGPQRFQFAHGCEGQSRPVRRGQQPELHRYGHGLVEGHALGGGLEPTHLNATTIGTRNVAEGLRRVETLAPLTGQIALLGHEAGAIEGTHGISAVGCEQHPLPTGRVAIHGQLEEVRAFEEIGFAGGIALDNLGQAPIAQIGRVEEVDGVLLLPLHVEHHHPLPGSFMPHHLGVAIASGDFLQNRVARKLGELAAVGAVGDALHRGIPGGGVNEHERRFAVLAEASGVLPVHHGAAAEHRSHVVGQELVSELVPVDEIATDGMTPVHVAPIPTVRIVLEEQVVLAVVEDHPVRIVVPTALR